MRIEDSEQRLRELWEVVVELVADARREERETHEEPFHVRVLARIRTEAQSRGDVAVLLRELAAESA